MIMKKYTVFLFCIIGSLLFGGFAGPKRNTPLCRVVTRVDIRCDEESLRTYTDTEKIEAVLLYLRLLDPLRPAKAAPEQFPNGEFQIQLTFSQGENRVFRQKAHRFFARDNAPWQTMDPRQATGLYTLILALPSDAEGVTPAFSGYLII